MSSSDQQRQITRIALETLEPFGFALAGSGSIREHGLINRPTEDIDLFTVMRFRSSFPRAITVLRESLEDAGLTVTIKRQSDMFARMTVSVSGDEEIAIDMGIDWRRFPPTKLEIGNVLNKDDAVGNKVAALFSRAEPRDFLDVDAIRQSGTYSDIDLIALAMQADPGFDLGMFIELLRQAPDIPLRQVRPYLISEPEFTSLTQRFTQWAHELGELSPAKLHEARTRLEQTGTVHEELVNNMKNASFPEPASEGVKSVEDPQKTRKPKPLGRRYDPSR